MTTMTPEQWFASLSGWQEEVVRWACATVGMAVCRERELRDGVWQGFTTPSQIMAVVRPLWDETWVQALAYREGALKAGVPPEAATEEAVMLRMFTTRILEWMVERVRAGRAAAKSDSAGAGGVGGGP